MARETMVVLYRRLVEYVKGLPASPYTAEEHARRLREDAKFWKMMGADQRAAQCEAAADRKERETCCGKEL